MFMLQLVSRAVTALTGLTGLPRDKLLHLAAGTGAALYGAAFGALAQLMGLHLVPASILNAGLTFAVVKELADWTCNRDAAARGEPPLHGVELRDAVFSAGAAVVLAAVVQAWR